jgi:hypothetical protein
MVLSLALTIMTKPPKTATQKLDNTEQGQNGNQGGGNAGGQTGQNPAQ